MVKDALIHIDGSKSCAQRIEFAISVAERFGAHITGLVLAVEPMPAIVSPAMVPAPIPAAVIADIAKAAQAEATAFVKAMTKAGLTPDCRTVSVLDMEAANTVALHARHCDFVILGQVEPEIVTQVAPSFPVDVIMAAGRPAVIVPWTPVPWGERILIAWDASREAARAVSDALPFLLRAKSVTVLSVNPEQDGPETRRMAGADIAQHLARHGVKVEAKRAIARMISVGEAILAEIRNGGHSMLVMGAYGHSRFREFVLGGVTREMLRNMTVPVLMSH